MPGSSNYCGGQSTIVPISKLSLSWGLSIKQMTLLHYITNEGRHRLFFLAFVVLQIGYFAISYIQLMSANNMTSFRDIMGIGLGIARGSANVINLNCAIILFTVCRNLMSALRSSLLNRVIPFDKNITFHIYIAYSIAIWSLVHIAAHYFNFMYIAEVMPVTPTEISLMSGPGITGQIISVSFFLMITSSFEAVRRKYFEMFWFTHHLFIVFFGGLLMHGSFCFIKADSGDICRGGPSFWKWWIASGVTYLIERLYREYRGRRKTTITKVVQHPSKVVEVQFKKDSLTALPGQYIFICCPEISLFEWHPYTLTSSPHEEFVSIHIRVVGDWTTKFADRLGCQFDGTKARRLKTLPYIMVDGGFGSASEDVFDYEAVILIGAGIGVTPFAAILKTIWYRHTSDFNMKKLKKVYFIWTCRDISAFSWFQDLLLTLEEEKLDSFLEIHSYLTGKLEDNQVRNIYINTNMNKESSDAITGLRAGTSFGRPNWDIIFERIREIHSGKDIGVFYCGPKSLSRVLHKCCVKYTEKRKDGAKFYFGKENF